MNAQQLEIFRRAVLLVLQSNGSREFGLTPAAITTILPAFGFRKPEADVNDALHYLAGKPLEFVELVDKKGFSPEIRSWKITTLGINFLAEQTNE